MLSLIAAMMFPPVTVIEPVAEPQLAYEFAFATEAGESREAMQDRLRGEAMDYCRSATRAAGVPGEARACARTLVAEVTDRADDDAYATFAQN